jgi:hypothetical protein
MSYDNTNKGIIGKNTRKEKDTHPDITGNLNVDGKEYFIDGWKKDRKDGSGSFYSLSVKLKDKQGQQPAQQGKPQQSNDPFDDGPPF